MGVVQLDEISSSTLLAGRYRCEELLSETALPDGPVRMWRAIDEVLSRPVVAQVVDRDHPCAERLVAAARAAAAANDPRLVSVFDAHVDGIAYVIREWFEAVNLDTLLSRGPMPADRAGSVAREVAEALAVAHAAGLAHRRLDLQSVLVTPDDEVKVVGLAIDVAVEGLPADASDPTEWPDPGARDDARDVGRVLHACLTSRWAGGGPSQLLPAPTAPDGHPLSPRQCRAGVPRPLDLVADRAMRDHPRHGPALATPAEVAAALADAGAGPPGAAVPAFSLPPVQPDLAVQARADTDAAVAPPHPRSVEDDTQFSLAAQSAAPDSDVDRVDTNPVGAGGATNRSGADPVRPSTPASGRKPAPTVYRRRRVGAGVVAVLVLAGVVLLGWQLTLAGLDHTRSPALATADNSVPPAPSATPTPGARPITIVAAGDYDPDGNNEEHPDLVRNAYDGTKSTAWTTLQYFGDPHLGKLKPGVGLWIDLGAVRPVATVHIDLIGNGTDLDLLVPNQPDANSAPPAFADWKQVARADAAKNTVTLTLTDVRARFVLVWLTKLPPDGTGNYRGGIREIAVRG